MPVAVLPTGGGMKIEDGVNSVLGADINNAIKVFEPLRLQHSRIEVI